jgi:hypothetical protein
MFQKSKNMPPIIDDIKFPHTRVRESAKFIVEWQKDDSKSKNLHNSIYLYHCNSFNSSLNDIYLEFKSKIRKFSKSEAQIVIKNLKVNSALKLVSEIIQLGVFKNEVQILNSLQLIVNVLDDLKAVAEGNIVKENSIEVQNFWNSVLAKDIKSKKKKLNIDDVFA